MLEMDVFLDFRFFPKRKFFSLIVGKICLYLKPILLFQKICSAKEMTKHHYMEVVESEVDGLGEHPVAEFSFGFQLGLKLGIWSLE